LPNCALNQFLNKDTTMLWTLFKILFFVVTIGAVTIGADLLMDSGEAISLTVASREFVLGPVQAVIAALALMFVLWLVLKLAGLLVATIRFLNGDDTALSRFFQRNRQRKGLDALTEGLLLMAAGDGKRAGIKAEKAEKLLDRPELTNLLIAQAAEMRGDRLKATEYYKRLVTVDRTRFVGVRGLLRQKLEEGDTATALKLAEKAFSMQPAHVETQDILLRMQNRAADWKGARATLLEKTRAGQLPRDVYKRRDAVLALQEAADLAVACEEISARDAAIEANRLSPDLIPAATMAARSLIANGKPKVAAKVIQKAWAAQPHPDLAAAFAEIVPDETPAARLTRFAKLFALKPDHDESRLLKAELLIAAEDFPEARRALGDLVEMRPNARGLTIMAAIERGEGSDDAVVRGWLTRALTASRGPQWVCTNCQHLHSRWTAICDNCESFDTLAWQNAPDSTGPSATQTEMLPLIVGALTHTPTASAPSPLPDKAEEVVDAEIADAEVLPAEKT
jgi:HemY protein